MIVIMQQSIKCLLCNKYSDQWSNPINREAPFDAISVVVGIKHLINTAFSGPNLIKFKK
jgi:hypothetical protein